MGSSSRWLLLNNEVIQRNNKEMEKQEEARRKELEQEEKKTGLGFDIIHSLMPATDKYKRGYFIIHNHGNYLVGIKNRLHYLLDLEGNLLSDIGFDEITYNNNPYEVAKNNNKYNVVNPQGKFISETWFDDITILDVDGFIALVKIDNKYHFINRKGEPISKVFYDTDILDYGYKIVYVFQKRKYNLKSKIHGTFISETGFDSIDDLAESIELLSIRRKVESIKEHQKKNNKMYRDNFPSVIIEENGCRIINPLFIEMGILKYVNFSDVSLKDVKLSGVSFEGCDLSTFNPQEVYNRDLRNCNFEGAIINPDADFTDVDIQGCTFTHEVNTLCDAIYDESTTFSGELPFTELYGECERRNNIK